MTDTVATSGRLAICLWDFTWYTRTGPDEPFEDLDRAFSEAVDRGYNCVRICALPFLLFRSGIDTSRLRLHPLGADYGQRTRWYDVRHVTTINAQTHLLALFRAAQRHGCRVIVSSWEYQQSPAFGPDDGWFRALMAVPAEERPVVLAEALADLVDLLRAEGLHEQVAFVELHNEVGRLADGLDADAVYPGLRTRLEPGIDTFRKRHPDLPVTANYARVPIGQLRYLPRNIDIAVFHPYVYGVLQELVDSFALRDDSKPFPQDRAFAELLRPGAPRIDDWLPPSADAWRMGATVMRPRELYVHDWCDPDAWDRWLYDRYGAHRLAMRQLLDAWIDAAADYAHQRRIPPVFGEGWVGYTPLFAGFEEGPVGADICAHAVHRSTEAGAWGTVVCSNAAPHHPMWRDVALQRELNTHFLHTLRRDEDK